MVNIASVAGWFPASFAGVILILLLLLLLLLLLQ